MVGLAKIWWLKECVVAKGSKGSVCGLKTTTTKLCGGAVRVLGVEYRHTPVCCVLGSGWCWLCLCVWAGTIVNKGGAGGPEQLTIAFVVMFICNGCVVRFGSNF